MVASRKRRIVFEPVSCNKYSIKLNVGNARIREEVVKCLKTQLIAPIYPKLTFGIVASVNSIIETILEKLKPKVYIQTISLLWINKKSLSAIKRKTIQNVQFSQANKLFGCV